MEVIMIQYSPDEKVVWERTKKGVFMRSEHVVSIIKTNTIMKRSRGTTKGLLNLAKSICLAVMSATSSGDVKKNRLQKATKYMDQANEHGTWRKTKIETDIKYKLRGVTELVKESELKQINNGIKK